MGVPVIRTALFALLLLCAPALADPVTVGTLIVGAEIGSTLIAGNVTIASVVGYTAITAATLALSIGVNAAFARGPTADARQSGQFVTRQPTPSRRRHYGRVKVGGSTIFSEVGTVGDLKILFRVVALNEGEIDAFEQFWLDDNQVLLSSGTSGEVVGAYMFGVTPFMSIETRTGLATETAYAPLVSLFPSIWTSNHRGDGVASLLVSAAQTPNFEDFTTVYPGGTAPQPRVVIRAVKVWDPRDGGQDKDDPLTWGWSDNPALIALDFHRHADGLGLSVFDASLFTSDAITEDWIPAANICDEVLSDGEKRWRCGGGYSIAEDAPADVLAQILATCDGQTFQRPDGAIGIRVGSVVDPAFTLTDDHILGYSDLKRGANVFNECNEVTAKYTSADHDYQLVDADPWRDEDDITERGQVLTKAISLPWVQHHRQARMLMKLAHARANPEWQGTIVTDMAGLTRINERYDHLTINEVGVDSPLIDGDFEIVPDSFKATVTDQGIKCSYGVSSLDQSAFDFDIATEAGTEPAIPADE